VPHAHWWSPQVVDVKLPASTTWFCSRRSLAVLLGPVASILPVLACPVGHHRLDRPFSSRLLRWIYPRCRVDLPSLRPAASADAWKWAKSLGMCRLTKYLANRRTGISTSCCGSDRTPESFCSGSLCTRAGTQVGHNRVQHLENHRGWLPSAHGVGEASTTGRKPSQSRLKRSIHRYGQLRLCCPSKIQRWGACSCLKEGRSTHHIVKDPMHSTSTGSSNYP
jgi:hypothetical protein